MKNIIFALLLMVCPLLLMAQQTDEDISDYKKIIVAVDGGYSLRLEKVPSGYTGDYRKHQQKLNLGYTYQASAYYMFNYRIGAGLEYSAYRSSDTTPGIYTVTAPNGESGMSKLSNDVAITFYGAGFLVNLLEESRHKLYFNTSFGYLRYKNYEYYMGNYKVTGGGLGTSVGFTYQYLIVKNFSIGPKISFSGSSIRKFTTTGSEGYNSTYKYNKSDALHFTRLDLGLQLMYRF